MFFSGAGFLTWAELSYTSVVSSLIAQSVERRTVNPQVPGSSPGRGAINTKARRRTFVGFFYERPLRADIVPTRRLVMPQATQSRALGDLQDRRLSLFNPQYVNGPVRGAV